VHGFDLVPEAMASFGAEGGSSGELADVAPDLDAVVIVVLNADQTESVLFGDSGVVPMLRSGAVVVSCATVPPDFARDMAAACEAHQILYLDAPISGGPPGAEAGTLGIMCSGDQATFEALKPALEAISGKLVYLNDKPGAAQTMKLVNNIISFGNLSVALEAMTLGAKAGLDPEQMLEVINASSGRNSATETKIPNHVLNRKFDYGGAMYIIEKDLELWRREAEAYQTPMWLGSNIRTLFMQSIAEVGRDADLTDLARTLEKMAGVEIPKTR